MAYTNKDVKPFQKNGLNLAKSKAQPIELELFVSGITPKSIRAIEVLKTICETYFADRYALKIIDIYREPHTAKENEVFAVPTLIRRRPGPKRMFIGDLSDAAPVLKALGIKKGSISNDK